MRGEHQRAAAKVAADIAEAMKRYRIRAPWTAESLALHTQAVLQGAFIMAKAKDSAAMVGGEHRSLAPLHRIVVSSDQGKRRAGGGETDLVKTVCLLEVVDSAARWETHERLKGRAMTKEKES